MILNTYLQRKKITFVLGIIFLIFIILRFPSLYEPYWYGDEGIYHTIGIALSKGRILYKEIWDNKPPLLYITYWLFGSNQFLIRLISLFVGLFSTLTLFFLSIRIYHPLIDSKTKVAKISLSLALIFAVLYGSPLLEGNIANAENFMMLPILISAFLILVISKNYHPKLSFIAGLLLSIAFLFKIVALFDFAAFFLFQFFIFFKDRKSFVDTVLKLVPFVLGFSSLIIITLLYFVLQGAFADFYNSVFRQMVGYVGYGNKLLIGQGLLFMKLLLLGAFSFFLFLKRKKIPSTIVFLLLWIAFSLFNAFFAGRPYTHYLLVLLPSFVLFFGIFFVSNPQIKKTYNFLLVFAILLFVLVTKNFTMYKKTVLYYPNFVGYITGQKSLESYYSFFDRNTPKDYKLAHYLNNRMKKEDTLFIWGNNAQVYTLTKKLPPGRFTVAYHMTANPTTLKETENILLKVKPKYILVTSSQNQLPFPITNYQLKFFVSDSAIYELL